MKSKLVLALSISTGALLLLIFAFVAGYAWRRDTPPDPPTSSSEPVLPGKTIERKEVPNLPPPPKEIRNPDRVRQNLQPGKTYVTQTKGTLHVRGEDKDWAVKEVVTINYAFEAQIDREIESNDGTTIVELRHFRDLRSLKVTCQLEDIRLDLGTAGDFLAGGLSFLGPYGAIAAGAIQTIDGVSLKPVLDKMRWAGVSPEKLIGLDKSMKAFTTVDRLTGKSVRLTYVDGRGVMKLEPVKGEMTPAERDFHISSVLVSDSLIVPDVDIKIGNRWSVEGANFANMVDPSLLARTSGEITLERAPDHIIGNETCRHLTVASGRILFVDPDPKIGETGHFEPKGSLFFSPKDQIVIKANLKGKGKLERFSNNHLLFESRMRRLPELEIHYTCRIVETLKAK